MGLYTKGTEYSAFHSETSRVGSGELMLVS